MPHTSKATASETVEVEGYEGHMEKLEGGYTAAFERYTADTDLAPLLVGLPDDLLYRAPRWSSSARRTSFSAPSTMR